MLQLWEIQKNDHGDFFRDYWNPLKAFTPARIALGRTGNSVPLNEFLDFKLAHANARDAVYSRIDTAEMLDRLESLSASVFHVKSRVKNRRDYLQRPDLGRQLSTGSAAILKEFSSTGFDVAIIVADGLSAQAINAHAVNLLLLLVPKLQAAGHTITPVIVAENARVAIGDEAGELLKAKLSILLIGERPGLTSPDSLGVYLTWSPKTEVTDEARNCVSNIRPQDLPYSMASDKIFYLTCESMRRKLTGVKLKEEMSPVPAIPGS